MVEVSPQQDVKRIKSLRKADIIQLANQQLISSHPDVVIIPDDYDISVQANDYEVEVNFRRYVRYFPLRLSQQAQVPYYDLSVQLIAKTVQPFAEGRSDNVFFIETEDDKKNILFVCGERPKTSPGSVFSIVETETHFKVVQASLNGYGFSSWDIMKGTGKHIRRQGLSAMPVPPPFSEPSPFAEPSYSHDPHRWITIND